MSPLKFFAVARRLLRGPDQQPPDDLLSPEQMRKVLARERARADRTADRFAVVTFVPLRRELVAAGWACLVKVLRARLRFTDEVGWLEAGQLCAVLAGTGSEGAWKVLEAVNERLGHDYPALNCTIYAYPPDSPPREQILGAQAVPGPATGAIVPLFEQSLPLWKRALDMLGAALGLMLLSPLLVAVAAVIKVTSPGPVLFGQLRSGRGGKPFFMWKFRSMVVNAEARKQELLAHNQQDGVAFKMKNDPRVTRIGRLLRSTSIDELPQLWNVLRGDMSLVGPRPLPCAETDTCAGWQRQRLDATPGLTCTWQVHGRCRVSFADWVRMDVRYIRSRSMWQDLKLLLLTVPAVLLRRGAH